jgi:hypothetical protein
MEKTLLKFNELKIVETGIDHIEMAYAVDMSGDCNGHIYASSPQEALKKWAEAMADAYLVLKEAREKRI